METKIIVLLVIAIALVFYPQTAFAYGIFESGQTGYDISFPQGSISSLPFSCDFHVVGVTKGRAYTDNSYLSSQVTLVNGNPLSLYMNLNAPIGSTVNGNTSTPKSYANRYKACHASNCGLNAATGRCTRRGA